MGKYHFHWLIPSRMPTPNPNAANTAAIDRIVHHSVILEFDVPSYRTNAAQNRQVNKESDRPE